MHGYVPRLVREFETLVDDLPDFGTLSQRTGLRSRVKVDSADDSIMRCNSFLVIAFAGVSLCITKSSGPRLDQEPRASGPRST